jgi:hypothetical protein
MNFRIVCVALLFASIVVGSPIAHAACSDASIKGTYGIVSVGLNGSLQPASSLAQITLDGAGNLAGTSTKSIDGSLVTYTITGTYNIATNCTGTAVFNNQVGDIEHDNFFINTANAAGLYAGSFLIQTDGNHVQSSIAVAQGAATCTNLGVKHPYSFEATGMIVGTGQIAAAGRLTLNGTGSITGTETMSVNGAIHSSLQTTGTYQINANCTGAASFTPKVLPTVNFSLVVVNGGKQIMAVETDTNSIVTGTFQE